MSDADARVVGRLEALATAAGILPAAMADLPTTLYERDGLVKKDTILLRDNDSVDVFLKFRDHLGPFVFHCHNMEHEDMAMMARFDVVPSAPL